LCVFRLTQRCSCVCDVAPRHSEFSVRDARNAVISSSTLPRQAFLCEIIHRHVDKIDSVQDRHGKRRHWTNMPHSHLRPWNGITSRPLRHFTAPYFGFEELAFICHNLSAGMSLHDHVNAYRQPGKPDSPPQCRYRAFPVAMQLRSAYMNRIRMNVGGQGCTRA
jgi:hypothetical protein